MYSWRFASTNANISYFVQLGFLSFLDGPTSASLPPPDFRFSTLGFGRRAVVFPKLSLTAWKILE
jgi:hypothetical protein